MNRCDTALAEIDGVRLGDVRLDKRARLIVEKLATQTGKSLPQIFEDDSSLEAAYRFLKNDRVSADDLLAPHFAQTAKRAGECGGEIIAIHDATEIMLGGDFFREGLGFVSNHLQGFFAHVSLLATSVGEVRDPLGLIHVTTTFRDKPKKKRRSRKEVANDPNSESKVWFKNIKRTEEKLRGMKKRPIHVGDRGADIFRLLADMSKGNYRFVFRNKNNRRIENAAGEIGLLHNAVKKPGQITIERSVRLNDRYPAELETNRKRTLKRAHYKRTPSDKQVQPARKERTAVLQATGHTVEVIRPNGESSRYPERLSINLVYVWEVNPPEGETPVEWLLTTNEPIETPEDIAQVIDAYRVRWLIEEFFKSLKTGCGYEKLQLEKQTSFQNALALFLPIAWILLRLRTLARTETDTPATEVLTETQIDVLKNESKKPISIKPSVHECMMAIAKLGGHITHNGPPGWLVLWRGFQTLLLLERGWIAAMQKRDQS
jgi:hypothetical protein